MFFIQFSNVILFVKFVMIHKKIFVVLASKMQNFLINNANVLMDFMKIKVKKNVKNVLNIVKPAKIIINVYLVHRVEF